MTQNHFLSVKSIFYVSFLALFLSGCGDDLSFSATSNRSADTSPTLSSPSLSESEQVGVNTESETITTPVKTVLDLPKESTIKIEELKPPKLNEPKTTIVDTPTSKDQEVVTIDIPTPSPKPEIEPIEPSINIFEQQSHACYNDRVTITATVEPGNTHSNDTFEYQWYKDGQPIDSIDLSISENDRNRPSYGHLHNSSTLRLFVTINDGNEFGSYQLVLKAGERTIASNKYIIQKPSQALSEIIDLSTTQKHSCAVNKSGELYCWGHFLNPDSGKKEETSCAKKIQSVDNVKSVHTRFRTYYIIKNNGEVFGWGNNIMRHTHNLKLHSYLGTLGSGNKTDKVVTKAEKIIGLRNITSLTGEASMFCATDRAHDNYCWGDNYFGAITKDESYRIDDISERNYYFPVLKPLQLPQLHMAQNLRIGSRWILNINTPEDHFNFIDGTTYDPRGLASVGQKVEHVTAWVNGGHKGGGVFISEDTLYLFGRYLAVPNHLKNYKTALPKKVIHLSGGFDTSCLAYEDGQVACIGNTAAHSGGPYVGLTEIPGIQDAVKVENGGNYGCVLTTSATVTCFGSLHDYIPAHYIEKRSLLTKTVRPVYIRNF